MQVFLDFSHRAFASVIFRCSQKLKASHTRGSSERRRKQAWAPRREHPPQAGGSLLLQAGRGGCRAAWEEPALPAAGKGGAGSTQTVQCYLAELYPTCPDRFPVKNAQEAAPSCPHVTKQVKEVQVCRLPSLGISELLLIN